MAASRLSPASRHHDVSRKVLCIGRAVADFINVVKEYPQEDSDERGLDCYWQRGGNASNSCTVLTMLSIPCEYMGVLGSEGVEASWIKDDFISSGIEINHCVIKPVHCPVAASILSQASGSRTIVYHPRDRPELTFDEFHKSFQSDFSAYSWIHFELCGNTSDVLHMIDEVLTYNGVAHTSMQSTTHTVSPVMVSIEVEKPELQNPELVMCKSDVIFISKDYAKHKGYQKPECAAKELYKLCKSGAVLVCAWGDVGAAAYYLDTVITSPALKDIKVVDSLGAGDTFVAGFIASLLTKGFANGDNEDENERKQMIEEALKFACHLAGTKCSMFGYKGLKDWSLGI